MGAMAALHPGVCKAVWRLSDEGSERLPVPSVSLGAF
jgi:hypothetical protein